MADKKLEDLPDDIYKLFDDDVKHEVDPENITKFAEEVAYAAQKAMAGREKREWRPYASSIGRPCLRQTWYEAHDAPREALAPNVKLKFLYGDIIESLLLMLAREAGHSVEREQESVELHGIRGRIDAIIDGTLVDVKSASSFAYKKFKEGTLDESNDPFGYLMQLGFYGECLGDPEPAFLAMDKQHAHVCVFEPNMFSLPTSSEIKDKKTLIEAAVSEDHPPVCAGQFAPVADGKSGNRKLCTNCSYCAYKYECWKGSNGGKGLRTFIYSTGPRFLTDVAVVPKVVEIPLSDVKFE